MLKITIAIGLLIALVWSAIHMQHQSHLPDSLGIGSLLRPFAYLLSCVFFFFLIWPPLLGMGIIWRVLQRPVDQVDIKRALLVFFLSLAPFFICLWLFLTVSAMARYRW